MATRLRIAGNHSDKAESMRNLSTRKFVMKYCTAELADAMIGLCQIAPEDPVTAFCDAIEARAKSMQ